MATESATVTARISPYLDSLVDAAVEKAKEFDPQVTKSRLIEQILTDAIFQDGLESFEERLELSHLVYALSSAEELLESAIPHIAGMTKTNKARLRKILLMPHPRGGVVVNSSFARLIAHSERCKEMLSDLFKELNLCPQPTTAPTSAPKSGKKNASK